MFKHMCLGSVLVLVGCVGTEGVEGEALQREEEALEIFENLQLAGYPEEEIDIQDDGTVVVGGDAVVSLQASREMIGHEEGDGDHFRQYRTTNLVGANIAVICIDGSAFTGTLGAALDAAINNYNALNLQFDMVRTTGSNAGCDAEITAVAKGAAGGSSGFPSGGVPYGTINVGKSTANYGLAVTTHVVAHELGHTIGLRHTDYFNRSISCGSGGNEGASTVGAIHIAGTPTGAVFDGSVMNACFHGGSTGQWTNSDVSALNALY